MPSLYVLVTQWSRNLLIKKPFRELSYITSYSSFSHPKILRYFTNILPLPYSSYPITPLPLYISGNWFNWTFWASFGSYSSLHPSCHCILSEYSDRISAQSAEPPSTGSGVGRWQLRYTLFVGPYPVNQMPVNGVINCTNLFCSCWQSKR